MSNLIGSEGMGVYQLIFPVFMICYTICCSGLFTAISKLVAAEGAKRNNRNISRIITTATLISFGLSIFLSIIIYTNSHSISTHLLNEIQTLMSIKLLALIIPFTALSTSVKGYFYGLKKTIIPASAQLLEQVIRILTVYVIASSFIPKGLEYACAMAVIGIGVGEILSCFYVIIAYRLSLSKEKEQRSQTLPYSRITKNVITIALPLTANRVLTTVLQSVENILIPSRLKLFGLSHSDALSIFGTLTGMALPLIMFPSVFTNSLSLMLLPTVSEARAANNKRTISYTTSKTLQYSLMIGLLGTCLFITFGEPLGHLIYHVPLVGNLLTILAWLCPFIYLNATLASILNGLDHEMTTFINNTLGIIIRLLFTVFVIPYAGLNGYLWGLLISSLAVSALDLIKIIQVTHIQFDVRHWLLKPILAAIASASIYGTLYYTYLQPYSTSLLILLAVCGLFVLTYCFFLILLKCIPRKDISQVKHSL